MDYYHHLIFDNSLTDGGYFFSFAAASAPSRCEEIDQKIPVAFNRFLSPPNSLKLSWLSKSGGDWVAEVRLEHWRGRDSHLYGDTLSFWAFSEKAIPSGLLPLIRLEIKDKHRSSPIRLGDMHDGIPANQWVQVKIPLKAFPNTITDKDFLRIEKVLFTQGIDDGEPHTFFIDEVKVLDSSITGVVHPPHLVTAVAYDRHVDLSWSDAADPAVEYYLIYRSEDGQDFQPAGIQNPSLW